MQRLNLLFRIVQVVLQPCKMWIQCLLNIEKLAFSYGEGSLYKMSCISALAHIRYFSCLNIDSVQLEYLQLNRP